MTEITRETKETQISCIIDRDGSGVYDIDTGVGFFDHMLEALSKHSGVNIDLKCKGDLHIDGHHTVEDCGIVLGEALKKEIFPILNIERYGNATIVMDEASISCDLDVSNRSYLVYEVDVFGKVGNFDTELAEEFFRAFVFNAGLTVHIVSNRGTNKHHILEATFKSFAVALRRALSPNKDIGIPSTKGVL